MITAMDEIETPVEENEEQVNNPLPFILETLHANNSTSFAVETIGAQLLQFRQNNSVPSRSPMQCLARWLRIGKLNLVKSNPEPMPNCPNAILASLEICIQFRSGAR
jgi:hypothetical protein